MPAKHAKRAWYPRPEGWGKLRILPWRAGRSRHCMQVKQKSLGRKRVPACVQGGWPGIGKGLSLTCIRPSARGRGPSASRLLDGHPSRRGAKETERPKFPTPEDTLPAPASARRCPRPARGACGAPRPGRYPPARDRGPAPAPARTAPCARRTAPEAQSSYP